MTDVAALSTPQIHDINMISASQIDQLDQMDLVPPSSSPSTSASRLIGKSEPNADEILLTLQYPAVEA